MPPQDLEEFQYIYERSNIVKPNAHFWFNTFTEKYLGKSIVNDPYIMGFQQLNIILQK